jgi:hypothetical protein
LLLYYASDEEYPIVGYVFVAPAQKAKLVSHPTAENQIHLVFETSGLHNIPDLLIQILLIDPVPGPWPPQSIILFGFKDIIQNEP